MNAHTSYALIAILAVVGTISFMPVFAVHHEGDSHELPPACPDCIGDSRDQAMMAAHDDIPVTVWTDSTIYDHESVIMVEGKVANVKMGMPVTLTVTSPSQNIVTIQQLDIDSNGKFATNLNTAGNLWKYDGTYTIKVNYGSAEKSNSAQVELTGGIAYESSYETPSTECGSNQIAAGDQCVPYSISGGMVTGANINTNDNSIVINIDAQDDGTLTVTPSKSTQDGIFMVLVDGEEWDDAEIDGNNVTVMFPAGAEMIEIIGTFVVPEFGTIAAMILAVAIISIIAVSAR